EMAVLVIEQNIGVACSISENVAIMVNGRINRVIEAQRLAADRALQQRLLRGGPPPLAAARALQQRLRGVGPQGDGDTPVEPAAEGASAAAPTREPGHAATRIYVSNPTLPTRWSQPVPVARIEAAARTSAASIVSLDDTATRRSDTKPATA